MLLEKNNKKNWILYDSLAQCALGLIDFQEMNVPVTFRNDTKNVCHHG